MKKIANYSIEHDVSKRGFKGIAGVDEVGYGPGAGPVVAAAVRIPFRYVETLLVPGRIRDSKKISAKKRESAYKEIIKICDYGLGIVNNKIIDEINVREATKLAMREAVNNLYFFDYLLIDGNIEPRIPDVINQNVIKGDSISISIAAASIVAKVTRDRIMCDLHNIYPIYEWNKNKGYLTKAHIEAIRKYKPSEFHRLSFRKVRS